MPEQCPNVRNKNFLEVTTGYTEEMAIDEAQRCLNCKHKPCMQGCPVSVKIPEFIAFVAKGEFENAYKKIKETNALPAVCGRVCPQEKQCESKCVRGIKGESVGIGRLERFVADWHMKNVKEEIEKPVSNGKRVAVVGSGPSGLTVAGDLAKKGYEVTIYEAFHTAGGVLMYGIPEFRLPKQVVRREVKRIKKLGVDFKLNIMVGTEITVDELFNQGFDAIFIGTGNALSKSLPIDGAKLKGVIQATYFLQMVELSNSNSVDPNEVPIKEGDEVVVIGGGNTAMDAARTAMRCGAKSVKVVNRRREEDMAALKSEIDAAKEEGVEIHALRGPVEIIGEDAVTGIKCSVREFDEALDKVVDTDGREYFSANKIIIAIGQKPASRIVDSTSGIDVDENGLSVNWHLWYSPAISQIVAQKVADKLTEQHPDKKNSLRKT